MRQVSRTAIFADAGGDSFPVPSPSLDSALLPSRIGGNEVDQEGDKILHRTLVSRMQPSAVRAS